MINFSPKQYTGAHFQEIFSEMLYANNTLDKGLVRIIPNIKAEEVITEVVSNAVIQPYAVTPNTPQGGITFSDSVLRPVKQMLHDRFDMNAFIGTRYTEDMASGAANMESNAFMRDVLKVLIPETGKKIEAKIWDLLLNKANNTAGITLPAVNLTVANILEEIKKVYAAIPGQVLKAKEAKIYVPEQVEQLLLIANADRTYRDLLTVTDNGIFYLNAPIEFVPLPDNTILAGRASDFVVGTDLVSDFSNLKVDYVSNESDLMFYKMVFTLDATICVPAQKVIYVA